ncbi:MBL fold metallo-hydrolase [Methylorubrum thiocyanatum]|uniref:MBL fold metallo-hydrolase n=1 Tax=Methylorubrum thiocyanatum TaxID=47958 RepID=UPI00383BD7D2
MKTSSVAEHGLRLTRFGFVNCYLVREADGLTLIDAGMLASSAGPILSAAAGLDAPIRRILLTHAHTDHIGAVDAMMAALGPDVELACSSRSLPLLACPPDLGARSGDAPGAIRGGLPGIRTRPARLLKEGDSCGSLTCLETPGHLPGHISFFDRRDCTLYAGDALIGMGRLAVPGYAPWYFFLPNTATQNKATARASAERLLDLPIARFACGHGAVKEGGRPLLEAALRVAS